MASTVILNGKLPDPMAELDVDRLLAELTLGEKVALTAGKVDHRGVPLRSASSVCIC